MTAPSPSARSPFALANGLSAGWWQAGLAIRLARASFMPICRWNVPRLAQNSILSSLESEWSRRLCRRHYGIQKARELKPDSARQSEEPNVVFFQEEKQKDDPSVLCH